MADLAFWFPIRGDGGNEHFYEFQHKFEDPTLEGFYKFKSLQFCFRGILIWYTMKNNIHDLTVANKKQAPERPVSGQWGQGFVASTVP